MESHTRLSGDSDRCPECGEQAPQDVPGPPRIPGQWYCVKHRDLVSDTARWRRDLTSAGWTAESLIKWRAPDGSLWRGPFGAWKELQRRLGADYDRA